MFTKLKNVKPTNWLIVITAFYVAGSILQNILAVKTFGTSVLAVTTGGTLISWLVFACMDVITEVFGKRRAILTFVGSAILNILFNIVCWIAISIPGTSSFINDAYTTVLGTGWRIALGSIIAFLLGNYINTQIMYVMKKHSKDSNKSLGFIGRAITSTLFGQLVDNGLFYLIAFAPLGIAGTVENSWQMIGTLVLCTTLIETVVESIVSPITAKFVKYLKSNVNK